MRAYETMYILKPDLEEETRKSLIEKFNNVITENGGQIDKVTELGPRRLAYEIEKFKQGYYVLLNYQAEPAVPQELERILRISDEVIRILTTVANR
ncbi:30S ribosomal protein S6 [Effusibacillus dendaii]|uniref:Small ribosomal subunit protein bS6 n=1 Tax=Effusibacillus dendaii TaxID=2743772 RepID=A0A7I8DBR2_9BACL|nr:30S ribosomal protein S6 [Effusibacillus dendaii]BCJ86782.1 30S ribosomal protein S6 [Effusibacillus dendaii]